MDLDGLNAEQREAVLHAEGPLVVFAGAGSGKTRVITHRVAHLVLAREVKPWRILAVTFTNKAAGEMRDRLERLVPGRSKDLWVGTFHATCARLLRKYHEAAGVSRDFNIYDDGDQKSLVNRVLGDMGLDERRYGARQVAGAINRAKNEVVTPDAMPANDPYTEIVRNVYAEYEKRLRQAGALDFGDLIYRLVLAMEEEPTLRGEIAGRFSHVLVDEFQDTNHAQYRLVRAMTGRHENVVVVGDDDQSIYGWRGADRRNILGFSRDYPRARVVKLEQNYRSTKRILRIANAIIEKNIDRAPKRLWTDNDEGPKALVVRCADERDEARMVVRVVTELLGEGHSLADAAVFYRVHAQSRVLEEALRAANFPYRVVGGVRFFDRAEVKDLLAYLRVIHNIADDVSLLRIINVPPRGIGKTTIDALLERASRSGTGVWSAIGDAVSSGDASIGSGPRKKLAAFRELVVELQKSAAEAESLAAVAEEVLRATGYVEVLDADDTPEADSRKENLRELVGAFEEIEAEGVSTLGELLERISLSTTGDEGAEGDRLTLMTVHAAKGLEFPAVIVTGLEEQMFPLRGGDGFEDPEELEEERRLAYVAFTRAEERLVLSWAAVRRIYGQMRVGVPSRFVLELPSADVQTTGAAPTPRDVFQGRIGGRRWSGAREPDHDVDDHDDGWATRRPLDAPVRPSGNEAYVDPSDASDLDGGVRVGMAVRHAKFGVGRVTSIVGGIPPRLRVRFEDGDEKAIVASYLSPA